MKLIIRFIIITFMLAFIKCNSTYNQEIELYKSATNNGLGSKTIKVQVYNIDSSFYNFLDTIIAAEIKCPYYNKCTSGFIFTIPLFTSSPDLDEILIASMNIATYDYSKCYGVFDYKGSRFICDSLCKKEFLKKSGDTSITYFITESRMPEIDDTYSTWYFIYSDNKISLYGHNPCYIEKENN